MVGHRNPLAHRVERPQRQCVGPRGVPPEDQRHRGGAVERVIAHEAEFLQQSGWQPVRVIHRQFRLPPLLGRQGPQGVADLSIRRFGELGRGGPQPMGELSVARPRCPVIRGGQRLREVRAGGQVA